MTGADILSNMERKRQQQGEINMSDHSILKFDKKAIAIKDGFMNPEYGDTVGAPFCYKGQVYDTCIIPGTEEDDWEDYYYLMDEVSSNEHSMDEEFFNEYFKLV